MPYPTEHACRLKEPNGQTTRRVNGEREHNGKKYDVIYQQKRNSDAWEEQAYRYPKETWTAEQARAHCKSHDGILFEPASGKAADGCVECGVKGAIPSHSTATTDVAWDDGAKGRLPSERGALKAAHAWIDEDGDPDVKSSYRFLHHMVNGDGDVGAANTRVCSGLIGVLNGGRGGTTIPADDKPGVWGHLARHLRDAGVEEIPALKGIGLVEQRAYAVLHVKAIDSDRRELTGTATTPSPDRLGDVVEPLGVTFRNPLPLLMYHDSRAPVGTVALQKPTKAGVDFVARIAKVDEAGTLKDRVDEAWQTVKAGLVRGVSIGFRVLEDGLEEIDTGFRFLKTEILELSLVAIPANHEATIQTIRSLDAAQLAALGRAASVTIRRSGAADNSGTRDRPMNVSERLTARRADLKAKEARLTEIVQGGEDVALSDVLQTESAKLAEEIKAIGADIDRLDALEQAQRRLAVPIGTPGDARGGAAAIGNKTAAMPVVEVVQQKLQPGIEFARYALCLMAARGSHVGAIEVAKTRYPDNPGIQLLLKAAVAGATTTDSTWLGPLVYPPTLVSEFVDYLRPLTILGKFGTGNIPSLRRVPFNVRILGQTTGASASWVGQGKQKPVTKFDVAVNNTLSFAKVSSIAVFAEELARFSTPSAESLIRDELARAIVERLDTDFVDPTKAAVANVSPASITNGLTALTPSGTNAAALRADLKSLFQTFLDANNPPTQGVFIMSNTIALAISLMVNALGQAEFPGMSMNGGTLVGLPVIASQYVAIGSPANELMILVNAADVFYSDDGGVSVDLSREATLEMSTDPENESGTNVNMWQTNQIALRAERFVNWAKRRASAAAYLDGCAYS